MRPWWVGLKLSPIENGIPLLIQIPGVGLLNALAFIAASNTIERLEKPKKLVAMPGSGPACTTAA